MNWARSLVHRVTRGVRVPFALGGHAVLGDHFAVHIGQKVRSINTIAGAGQEVDAAKSGASLTHHTFLQGLTTGVEVNADAARCQTSTGPKADHAKVASYKWHFNHLGKVVHFSRHQLSEPWGHHAIAIVEVEFGGLVHDFLEGQVLLIQVEHGLLAGSRRTGFQGQLGFFFQRLGKTGRQLFGHLFRLGFAGFFGVGLVIGSGLVLGPCAGAQGQTRQQRNQKVVQRHGKQEWTGIQL